MTRRLARHETLDAKTVHDLEREAKSTSLSFTGASLLPRLAQAHQNSFDGAAACRDATPSGQLSFACFRCGPEVCQTMQAIAAVNNNCSFTQAWVAYSNIDKARSLYAAAIAGEPKKPTLCIFCDKFVGDAQAACATHGKACSVKTVDILCAIANGGNAANNLGDGLSFRKCIERNRPCMLCLEFTDKAQSQVEACETWLASLQYEGQTFKLSSTSFGVPRSQTSWYGIFVSTTANPLTCFRERSIGVMCTTMKGLVSLCQRKCYCATSVLLPPEDTMVQDAARRRSCGEGVRRDSGAWKAIHMKAYRAKGIPWGSGGAVPALSAEETSVLNYARRAVQGRMPGFVDLSVAPPKLALSETEAGCEVICPLRSGHPAVLWIESEGRLLLPTEVLAASGFVLADPSHLAATSTVTDQWDIVSSTMHAPVLLALLMAAFRAISWKERSAATSRDSSCADVAAADAIFLSMMAAADDVGDKKRKTPGQ